MAPPKPLTPEQRDLVERYVPLAYSRATRRTNRSKSRSYEDDAKSVALVALCEAARTFDGERGTFGAWAERFIAQALHRFFRRGARVVPRSEKGTGEILPEVSLDVPADADDGLTHLDLLANPPDEISPETAFDVRVRGPLVLQEMRQQVASRIRGRREPALRCVDAFFEQELEGQTLEVIGQRRGVTRERARQLIERARPAFEAWKADTAKEAA